MIVHVRRASLVHPAEATPRRRLWCNNLDLVSLPIHARQVFFYRPDGSPDFFDVATLRESLSRVLVPLYPLAGRLGRDECGRIEINCGGQGVLFVEAETDMSFDGLADFAPTNDFFDLVPKLEYTDDISSFPLLVLQVTKFKCGGVSLGIGVSHQVVDGNSAFMVLVSWGDVNRGLNVRFSPVFDRTLLSPRDPPSPSFPHVEYQPPPLLNGGNSPVRSTGSGGHPTKAKVFEFSPVQLALLRQNAPPGSRYSSFALLAAHLWRCVCAARELPVDQVTRMYIPANGRQRLQPPLPDGYIGDAIFLAAPTATVGEVIAGSGAERVQAALTRMDDDYLRSALDYLELQPDLAALARGAHTFRSPNLGITNWARFPVYMADFGWGPPARVVPLGFWYEGLVYVLPSPSSDGGVCVTITLPTDHMHRFEKLVFATTPLRTTGIE